MHTRTGIALLVLAGLAGTALGQSTGDGIEVVTVKAKFAESARSGRSKHRLKLTLRVSPRQMPFQHEGAQHRLRVTLDDTALCDVAPGSDGYRVRKNGRWKYRGDVAGGHVRLSGDGRSGTLKLRITGANLPQLRDSPASDLALAVELAGTDQHEVVSFRVIDGRVRRWRGLVFAYPPPDPGGGPGPGPFPGPPPDPRPAPTGDALKQAILADMQRRGVSFDAGGPRVPAGGFDAINKRCPDGRLAEAVVVSNPPSPGSTDRMFDTAYFCRDSRRYWLNRTGGIAAFNLWLGPYDLP